MQKSHKGYFISLEGGEGSGKTGHIPNLVEYLRSRGLIVFPTREPGGTSISEQIREILKDPKNKDMHPRTEALLFQSARAQIVENVIKPRLAEGQIVIADRYFDATIAYQGYGRGLDVDGLKSIINFATGGLTPDLTVLLDVDPEIGLARRGKAGGVDRLDGEPMEFHRRVNQAYRDLANIEPDRWIVVDANKSIDIVYSELRRKIEDKLIFNNLIEGSYLGKENKY